MDTGERAMVMAACVVPSKWIIDRQVHPAIIMHRNQEPVPRAGS